MTFKYLVVELNGALSNPQVALEVHRTMELKARLLAKKEKSKFPPKAVKRRQGEVAGTVYIVMSEDLSSMRAKDVHRACEAQLGHTVSWSTVKACLSDNSKGPHSKFLRVGHGRYLLRF